VEGERLFAGKTTSLQKGPYLSGPGGGAKGSIFVAGKTTAPENAADSPPSTIVGSLGRADQHRVALRDGARGRAQKNIASSLKIS